MPRTVPLWRDHGTPLWYWGEIKIRLSRDCLNPSICLRNRSKMQFDLIPNDRSHVQHSLAKVTWQGMCYSCSRCSEFQSKIPSCTLPFSVVAYYDSWSSIFLTKITLVLKMSVPTPHFTLHTHPTCPAAFKVAHVLSLLHLTYNRIKCATFFFKDQANTRQQYITIRRKKAESRSWFGLQS